MYYVEDLENGVHTVVSDLKDAEKIIELLKNRQKKIRDDLRKTELRRNREN